MAALVARPRVISVAFFAGCLFLIAVSAADETPPGMPSNSRIFSDGQSPRRNAVVSCTDKRNRVTCSADCPKKCRNRCVGMCPGCKTFCICDLVPGAVCGDPRFTGADGNNFYFHGKKDQDFCILSDSNLHINAHFIGNHNPEKNRNFTWVQALGIIFGDNHQLYVGVKKTVTWDDSVDHLVMIFDGQRIKIPTEVQSKWALTTVPSLFITRTSETNGVMVELRGIFTILADAVPITKEESDIHNYGVTRKDSLAHLELSFKFQSLSENVDGVLGQTYRPDYVNKFDVRKNMPLMTNAAKYSSSSIFATDCAVNRFRGEPEIAVV